MGKVSPKERGLKNSKQRKGSRGSGNKYLKPGALAQLKYSKAGSAKACTDLGRKRVAVVETKKPDDVDLGIADRGGVDRSSLMLSPVNLVRQSSLLKTPRSPLMLSFVNQVKQSGLLKTPRTPLMLSPVDFVRQNSLTKTPRTPRLEDCESESRLESLLMDLLVKLLCHLHHDQLKPVFHVSQRIRKAVILARQYHFNYTTPDRSRQEMLRTMTPHPTECPSKAREMARAHGYEARIHQKHQDMVPDHHLASKFQKCGRLLQFSFRSQTFLLDAWCHLPYHSPCANLWLPIEFCSMRKSFVRLWFRISFFKLIVASSICMYIVCLRYPYRWHGQVREYEVL